MSSATLRIAAAVLLLLSCSIPSETQDEKPPGGRVWFAVEERPRGEVRIEPFAIVSDGQLVRAPSICSEDDSGVEKFASTYLQPNQEYPVLFGGAAAGTAHILSQQANSTMARVSYDGPVKLRGPIRALAASDAKGGFRVESREPASKEERAAALSLARTIFRQHGVPEEQLAKVHADFVTRTVIAPASLSSWIGAFTLETSKDYLQHNLFFIASQGVSGLEAELVWVRIGKQSDEDEAMQLVDHGDLLGDGHDEVVVRFTSTENHRFGVYKRGRDGTHWEQMLMTAQLECR